MSADRPARFTLLPWGALNKLPPAKWLIKGVLGEGGFSALVGASGSLKTFIAIDIAAHIARGIDWCGRRVKSGAVLFIAAEGGNGMVDRLRAYSQHYGFAPEKVPLYVLPEAVNLLSHDEIDDLIQAVCGTGKDKFSLIVVDTYNRSLAGETRTSLAM